VPDTLIWPEPNTLPAWLVTLTASDSPPLEFGVAVTFKRAEPAGAVIGWGAADASPLDGTDPLGAVEDAMYAEPSATFNTIGTPVGPKNDIPPPVVAVTDPAPSN
jgi:hypothetical protein